MLREREIELHDKSRQIIELNDGDPGRAVLSMQDNWDFVRCVVGRLLEGVVKAKSLTAFDLEVQVRNVDHHVGRFITSLELATASGFNIEQSLQLRSRLSFATFAFVAR